MEFSSAVGVCADVHVDVLVRQRPVAALSQGIAGVFRYVAALVAKTLNIGRLHSQEERYRREKVFYSCILCAIL